MSVTHYFQHRWLFNDTGYPYSSKAYLQIQPDEYVLDVGCGPNPYKNKIKNITGIDPAFDRADYKCTIEEFNTDVRYDVAFCFGSINYGSEETISNQIDKVVSLLKPNARIYWRIVTAGRGYKNFKLYIWTLEKLNEYAIQHGFVQTNTQQEDEKHSYAEWHRST